MIYKETALSKKQILLTASLYLMFALLFCLVRLSMECGNLAREVEVREHLLDNIWILRYLPMVVLAFSYNPSAAMYEDIESGFMRLCRTTPYSMERLIGAKMITLLLFEAGVFSVNVVYLAILSLIGGDALTLPSILILLKMTLFFSALLLLMLFFSTIAKSKNTFDAAVVGIVSLAGIASTPLLMQKMEKYSGREDIDVLDLLRLEFAPMEKYVLPACVLILCLCALLCRFIAPKLLERREG